MFYFMGGLKGKDSRESYHVFYIQKKLVKKWLFWPILKILPRWWLSTFLLTSAGDPASMLALLCLWFLLALSTTWSKGFVWLRVAFIATLSIFSDRDRYLRNGWCDRCRFRYPAPVLGCCRYSPLRISFLPICTIRRRRSLTISTHWALNKKPSKPFKRPCPVLYISLYTILALQGFWYWNHYLGMLLSVLQKKTWSFTGSRWETLQLIVIDSLHDSNASIKMWTKSPLHSHFLFPVHLCDCNGNTVPWAVFCRHLERNVVVGRWHVVWLPNQTTATSCLLSISTKSREWHW